MVVYPQVQSILTLLIALDPKPYIRTFEAVLHELERLQSQLIKNEENSASEVKSAEIRHCQNIITSSQKIGVVLRDFGTLDDTVGDVSTATSMLNGKLEKLSSQYEKSVESGFLITTYLNLNKRGSCADLDKLWDSNNPANKRKCANVVRQLQLLSKKLEDAANGDRARDAVDSFAEKLERDLLNDFDNAYRSADLVVMKESADILTDFNGGSSVVQMFVNQHDYFILQENLVDSSLINNEEMWTKMSDPEGDVTEFEEGMKKMIDGMEEVIMQELEIIRKVFRNPVVILKVFLQRVFAQRIQLQIETYLNKAESLSTLAYMRTLHIGYAKINMFTASLKASFTKLYIDSNGELAALLDQNFSDIFVPYIENGQYFEAELRSLSEIITQEMYRFTESHSHKTIREQSLLSRFTSSGDNLKAPEHHLLQRHDSYGSIASAKEGNNGSSKETGRIGQLIRAVRLERSRSASGTDTLSHNHPSNGSNHEDFDETDGELKLDMVEKVLTSIAEGVQRDLELAEMSQIPNHARSFLSLLLETLGKGGIDVILEEATQMVTSQEGKSPVDLSYLKYVREATNTVMLLSTMIKTVIYPMVSTNAPQVRSAITMLVNNFLERVDFKVNKILLTTIDACLARISNLLSKQKKKDFLPKEESNEIVQQTVTCSEISQFLVTIHKSVLSSLNGPNLDILLEQIGIGFRDLLLDHFKKFSVNRSGGLIVTKDIEAYREGVFRWSIEDVTTSFLALDGISELFTALPQDIPQLVRSNQYLAQSKTYTIREYLSKRTDYMTANINKMFAPGVSSRPQTSAHLIPMYTLV